MSKPLITVGIPAFNAEDTVGQAIASALEQSWRPIEIIVVDDASNDNTRCVVDAIARRNDEIRVVTRERNSGVALARNEVVARAAGEFIVFFDDDDVSLPNRVERQFDRLTGYELTFAQGAPVVCHTARDQIYPDGSRRIEGAMGIAEARAAPSGLPVARHVLMGAPLRNGCGSCPTSSQMARTAVYRTLGGFDAAFRRAEDTDFCIRLARIGGHFVGIATPLVVQIMTKSADKNLAQEKFYTLALLEKHRDLFDDEDQYRFCCEWIELKYLWLSNDRPAFTLLLAKLGMRRPALTLERLYNALPSLNGNRAFRDFHREHD